MEVYVKGTEMAKLADGMMTNSRVAAQLIEVSFGFATKRFYTVSLALASPSRILDVASTEVSFQA